MRVDSTSNAVRPENLSFEMHGQLAVMYELQRRFGMRYSELAAMTPRHLIDSEYIYVPGKKKSNNRLLYCPDLIAFINVLLSGRTSGYIFTVSYHQYFNFVSKRVPDTRVRENGKRRVTHYFRAKIIQKFKGKSYVTNDDIKGFTGHRSQKSLLYYLREFKR